MAEQYIAGKHNIGVHEIRHRKLTYGWGGAALSFAVFWILYFLGISYYGYLILFIPIYISVIGFMQAREHFCVSYGKSGQCNIAGQSGEPRDVIGQLNRKKDARKANAMIRTAIIISAGISLGLAFISNKGLLT